MTDDKNKNAGGGPPSRRGVAPVISPEAQSVLEKKAAMTRTAPTGGGLGQKQAAVQVVRSAPKVYSPLTENSNLQMPRDLRTLNSWCRHFYNINPLVRNAINLHSTYPISKIQLQCEDRKIKQFFEDQFDHINMPNFLQAIALEWWKLGEALPHLELDEAKGVWSHGYVHNPDYIRVQVSPLAKDPVITLIPDEQLKRIVNGSTAQEAKLRRQLPAEICNLIRQGMDIPLNNFNVSHLKSLSSDYDIRGTSIITCVFKDLMLYDKLREAEFVQADDMVNPITHVKLGDPQGTWRPDDSDISDMRRAIEEAMYDPDFKLITHGAVQLEVVGKGGAVLDTSRMWEMINKNILLGLMVPEEILAGNGASYASATVGLEVLRSRYDRFRNVIEQWLYRKVLEPIAKIQDFYKWEHGRRKLIVPKIQWNKMNLRDVESYISTLGNLVGEEPGTGKISTTTLLSLLDVDSDQQDLELRKEAIQAMVRVKEKAALSAMTLEELRTLDPTKPVPDLHPQGGVPPAGGSIPGPQEEGGGELGGEEGGGLDLGGLLGGGGGGGGGGEPLPDLGDAGGAPPGPPGGAPPTPDIGAP